MKILIVTEKPSLTRTLIQHIQDLNIWPEAEITFLPVLLDGLFRFSYPKKLRLSDFPYVGEPGYKMRKHAPNLVFWPVFFGICGNTDGNWILDDATEETAYKWFHLGFYRMHEIGCDLLDPDKGEAVLEALVQSSDLIINMTDADSSSAGLFHGLLSHGRTNDTWLDAYSADRHFGSGLKPEICDAPMTSLVNSSISKLLESIPLVGTLDGNPAAPGIAQKWVRQSKSLSYHEAREFFDYHWILNATALFDTPFRLAHTRAGNPDAPAGSLKFLSKYAILFLLHLAQEDGQELTEGQAIRMMECWEGSGKYNGMPDQSHIGSPATRFPILSNLRDLGLLCHRRENGYRVSVSPAGMAFARSLPKICYDPDLPFRLHRWALDWPSSKPKVEAYFRRYFGAVKRKFSS